MKAPVERTVTAFLNLLSQLPGLTFGDRDYRLLVSGDQVMLLVMFQNRLTVFDLVLQSVYPNAEYQCSAFEYICRHQVPKAGIKEYKLAFDVRRRLHHGARVFCTNVNQRFNLKAAHDLAARLGVTHG